LCGEGGEECAPTFCDIGIAIHKPKSNRPTPVFKILDANEAATCVAYGVCETMAIYPATPPSPIAEWCDQWASEGKKNL